MKRSGFKNRGKGLKKGGPIVPKKSLVSRSSIRPVSAKHQRELRKYFTLAQSYLKAHPICETCEKRPSVEIHHRAKRGKHLCSEEHFIAICRPCHIMIEDNKGWARQEGWLI